MDAAPMLIDKVDGKITTMEAFQAQCRRTRRHEVWETVGFRTGFETLNDSITKGRPNLPM